MLNPRLMASQPKSNTKLDHPDENPSDWDGSVRHFSNSVITYSRRLQEVIDWLLSKEKELHGRPQISDLQEFPFSSILEEYSSHEAYVTELCKYNQTIDRCKETGLKLRNDVNLTDEDKDEVEIQMDTLLVCHEKLKILATDRLKHLQSIMEEQQKAKIEKIEEWLGSMESRIAASNDIGPDHDSILRQIRDITGFKEELAQKQELINFIADIITFDEIDPDTLELRNKQCENLEIQLETINRRWIDICQFVDGRYARLKKAESIWKNLNLEEPQLTNWLKKIEISLDEVTDALRNIVDPQSERTFITKLLARSSKIDAEIKSKQSFYTSLENRVRDEILKFDDPYSMLVIELERKLEDMQFNWNTIMNRKRVLDFSLQNPSQAGHPHTIIPVPEPITPTLDETSHINKLTETNGSARNPDSIRSYVQADDRNSRLNLDGSLSEQSRALDNSFSSTKSFLCSNVNELSLNDSYSQEDLSMENNIVSPSLEKEYAEELAAVIDSGSQMRADAIANDLEDDLKLMEKLSELENEFCSHDNHHSGDAHSSCRVEEWKHSLESFSNWLKQVEASLEMDGPNEGLTISVPTWSKMSPISQLNLLSDIENRIETTCQNEFDCLLLQGQQIIEDLMPEIGENEYERNLKEILTEIDLRYGAVKRVISNHKRDFADRERWHRLTRKLKDTSIYLVEQIGKVIPETDIGVDLITLAQQQDHLVHLQEDTENNMMVHSSIQEAKLFLSLYETLEQQYGPNYSDRDDKKQHIGCSRSEIWKSFKQFKDDIEDQLDKVTLHHSELSQIIKDRMDHLGEVHRQMSLLQCKIQELAAELQVAEILKSNWLSLEELSIEQLSEQLEDLKIYRERTCDIESVHRVMNAIIDQMNQCEIPLSQSNLKRLEELSTIWHSIQLSVEERQREIEHAFDEQSGSEQKFLAQTISDCPRWERKVATSKVPYFFDHNSNKTSWDHPKFTELLNTMEPTKKYLFSVYRTAFKVRMVQKRLSFDRIMLDDLKTIFDSFDSATKQSDNHYNDNTSIQTQASTNELPVGIEHLIMLLKAIYERIQSDELPELDVPLAIDLSLNWLLNLYDSTRTGHVNPTSIKVGLALLCCATLEEKYAYIHELFVDKQTGTIQAKKLGSLLETCLRIPIYFGESDSFGSSDLIEKSIRGCYAMSKFHPQHPNSITQSDYMNWLRSEPQFIIWLPVLHRILYSEEVAHAVKCNLCRKKPIVGLRYRCLNCFKFNICQECFLTGRHIQEHFDPDSHPLQEYCEKTNSGENVRDITKILRNKLHISKRQAKSNRS